MSPPLHTLRRDAAFGYAATADQYHAGVTSAEEVLRRFEEAARAGRPVVLRGEGRSYSDASLFPESVCLDVSRLKRVIQWDPAAGVIEVEGGMTVGDLWRYALPDGYWPFVVPGTSRATLAGAVSADVHGKNNPLHGTFMDHVEGLELVTPGGGVLQIGAEDELFRAVGGGWGLLGFVSRIRLRLHPVRSAHVFVRDTAVRSWDELFALLDGSEAEYRVGWVNGFHPDGRGVFTEAQHGRDDEPLTLNPAWQEPDPKLLGLVRRDQAYRYLRPWLNRPGMRLLSGLKYLAARHRPGAGDRSQSLVGFHFPLDYVPHWQRAYLPGQLVQFQVAVPRAHARHVFSELLNRSARERLEPYLGVVKRHRPDGGLLSYLLDGYSVALDYHRTDANAGRLNALLRELADLALDYGGRFYGAKDAILNARDARRMFGDDALQRFARLKNRLDPQAILQTELGRRWGLGGEVQSGT